MLIGNISVTITNTRDGAHLLKMIGTEVVGTVSQTAPSSDLQKLVLKMHLLQLNLSWQHLHLWVEIFIFLSNLILSYLSIVPKVFQNFEFPFIVIIVIFYALIQVAQMLEATYNSVHSSFRAVLSVADHFSKLRQQLVKILRSFMMLGIGQR